MKIKKLNIAALTMAGLLIPYSLCGCGKPSNEKTESSKQEVITETTTEEKKITKRFEVGEHYIAVRIEDPTKQNKQYDYIPGYKPVGISTSAYGQTFYSIVGSEMLYINDYPVEVTATRDKDGMLQFNSFGTPLEYEHEKREKIDGKLKFLPGEHIISVPVSREMIEENDFEVHKGYEPIGIAKAMSGKNFAGFAGACILYINTETVLCTKDENNEYTIFGIPEEVEKVNIK